MTDILRARLIARSIDARCLEFGDVETNLAGARQKITVKQGIEQRPGQEARSGAIKDAKLKVDSQINGDKLRVDGQEARRPAGRDRAAAGPPSTSVRCSSTTSATEADRRTGIPIAATRRWLERAVIGLNLCPFAKAVYVKQQVRFVLSQATTPEALLDELAAELLAAGITPIRNSSTPRCWCIRTCSPISSTTTISSTAPTRR